ncbi:hypothetical protein K469DRAFT_696525 [Zopfia rhizophila CBS 207.26]|uniref:Uncharacterized protein n=1 Tax=Zopfia rhizophila CBS 207.26 TaxID=1314779 RepID=A0A6A6DGT3_9PEZI|nr:hypothetical protein K469DRAFT_696525 [Zopfia rhizophila CBS 207.26]
MPPHGLYQMPRHHLVPLNSFKKRPVYSTMDYNEDSLSDNAVLGAVQAPKPAVVSKYPISDRKEHQKEIKHDKHSKSKEDKKARKERKKVYRNRHAHGKEAHASNLPVMKDTMMSTTSAIAHTTLPQLTPPAPNASRSSAISRTGPDHTGTEPAPEDLANDPFIHIRPLERQREEERKRKYGDAYIPQPPLVFSTDWESVLYTRTPTKPSTHVAPAGNVAKSIAAQGNVDIWVGAEVADAVKDAVYGVGTQFGLQAGQNQWKDTESKKSSCSEHDGKIDEEEANVNLVGKLKDKIGTVKKGGEPNVQLSVVQPPTSERSASSAPNPQKKREKSPVEMIAKNMNSMVPDTPTPCRTSSGAMEIGKPKEHMDMKPASTPRQTPVPFPVLSQKLPARKTPVPLPVVSQKQGAKKKHNENIGSSKDAKKTTSAAATTTLSPIATTKSRNTHGPLPSTKRDFDLIFELAKATFPTSTKDFTPSETTPAATEPSSPIPACFDRVPKPYDDPFKNDVFVQHEEKKKKRREKHDEASSEAFSNRFHHSQKSVNFSDEQDYSDEYVAWKQKHVTNKTIPCLDVGSGCTPKKEEMILLGMEDTKLTSREQKSRDAMRNADERVQQADDFLRMSIRARVPVPIGVVDGRWKLYCVKYANQHFDRYSDGKRTLIINESHMDDGTYTAKLLLPPRGFVYYISSFSPPPHASFRTTIIKTAAEGYPLEVMFLGNGYLKLRVDINLMLKGKPAKKNGKPKYMEFVGVHNDALLWAEEKDEIEEEVKRLWPHLGGYDD